MREGPDKPGEAAALHRDTCTLEPVKAVKTANAHGRPRLARQDAARAWRAGGFGAALPRDHRRFSHAESAERSDRRDGRGAGITKHLTQRALRRTFNDLARAVQVNGERPRHALDLRPPDRADAAPLLDGKRLRATRGAREGHSPRRRAPRPRSGAERHCHGDSYVKSAPR